MDNLFAADQLARRPTVDDNVGDKGPERSPPKDWLKGFCP
jgi:hypothetical protein